MCQKVMIAMAIANQPRLLVADEPTSAMESTTHSQILRLLDKMNKLGNTTILIISNDIAAIANLTDTINVMYCGQMVEVGTRSRSWRHRTTPIPMRCSSRSPTLTSWCATSRA